MKHYLAKGMAICAAGITIDGRPVTVQDLQALAIHYDEPWLASMLVYDHDDLATEETRNDNTLDTYYGKIMALHTSPGSDLLYADIAYTDNAIPIIESGAVRDFSCGWDQIALKQDPVTGDITVGIYLMHLAMVPLRDHPAVPGLSRPQDLLKNSTVIELEKIDLETRKTRLSTARERGEMKPPEDKTRLAETPPGDGSTPESSALVDSAKAAMPKILAALGNAIKSGDEAAIKASRDELDRALMVMGIGEAPEDEPAVPPDAPPQNNCGGGGDPNQSQYKAQLEAQRLKLEALEIELAIKTEMAEGRISTAEAEYFRAGYKSKKLSVSSIQDSLAFMRVTYPEPRFDGKDRYSSAGLLTPPDITTELTKLSTSKGWKGTEQVSDAAVIEWLKRKGALSADAIPDAEFIASARNTYHTNFARLELERAEKGAN